MMFASLIALALLGLIQEPPEPWIARLSAADPLARAEAVDALEAAGLSALPALRRAVATAEPGGETRRLADDLIRRIGAQRLLRGTRVSLDFADRSVADAVAALAKEGRVSIDLPAPPDDPWRNRKLTIREPAPLPFFEALDRLGVEAGFRHDASVSYAFPPASGVRIHLARSEGPRPPTAYAGPYRARLASLNRHRSVAQVRPPAEAKAVEDVSARIEVAAEPGLQILPNGPIRLLEGVDDRGRDLRPDSTWDTTLAVPPAVAPGTDGPGAFSYRLPLKLPEPRGRAVARLRGFVPVVALARTDELFSAPWEGLAGKTFSGGGVTLTVLAVGVGDPATTLDVVIRGEAPPPPPGFAPGPRRMTQAILTVPPGAPEHLRVEDSDGRPVGVNINPSAPRAPDGTARYRVQVFAPGPDRAPARLRYFGIAAVATEIPFDFRDLPIP